MKHRQLLLTVVLICLGLLTAESVHAVQVKQKDITLPSRKKMFENYVEFHNLRQDKEAWVKWYNNEFMEANK